MVPGRYLAREQADGSNPGADYIRVAMVQNNEITAEAMHRLVAGLSRVGDDGKLEHEAMSMIDRSIDGMAALSGQLGAILRRRLREMGGIALISLAMMAALALATWSVQDPSLSHATDAPVHNLLGMPGAVAADLMMQLLGLGSLALLLPVAVWGYRLLGHRRLSHERLRVLLWLVGAALTAAFASCLPSTAHWPLPSGLGGVVGDAMLRLPVSLLHIQLVGAVRFARGDPVRLRRAGRFRRRRRHDLARGGRRR